MSEPDLEWHIPPEHKPGTYAHAFSVSYTAFEFTIDFAVVDPQTESNGEPSREALVVARVRIPPALAFALIRSINARMTAYEAEWGEIRGPQPPDEGASA